MSDRAKRLARDDGPSDRELLEAWRAGDRSAGEAVFQRYYKLVYRFFCNKIHEDRRDLIQQTFLAVVEGRDRLHNDDHFRSYLLGVARNIFHTHVRRKYRAEIDLDTVSVADLSRSPDEIFAQRRNDKLLLKALRRISIERQILLELDHWEDLPSTEISKILGIPDNTVRSRLNRARDQLRAVIEELAESPAELSSTLDNLDAWAQRCRRRTDPGDPGQGP
jgi:RNA polymerase sigma-70 factor, ECF subfamily